MRRRGRGARTAAVIVVCGIIAGEGGGEAADCEPPGDYGAVGVPRHHLPSSHDLINGPVLSATALILSATDGETIAAALGAEFLHVE